MAKIFPFCIHFTCFLLLGYCTVVQFNDPDSLMWIAFYALATAVPFLNLLKKYSALIGWPILAFGIGLLIFTVSGFLDFWQVKESESLTNSMSPDKPFIEQAREFLGTLFAVVVIIGYQLYSFKKPVNA